MEPEPRIWLNRISRRELLKYGVVAGAGFATADLLAACGGSGSTASTITMKLGTDSPIDAAHSAAMVTMKNEIESKTGGRIKCVVYPDAQLGDSATMLNGVKAGTLDATITDMAYPATAVPECGVFSLPFLFKDGAQALRACNGATGAVLKPKIQQAFACEVVGWGSDGSRNMWNKKRAIATPADVKGLKMRTQPIAIQQDTYSAFGALPTPMALTELYTALQTGVVDGGDNGPVDFVAFKFYETGVKFMTLTRHQNTITLVVVSNKFMSKLSSQDQDIVRQAGVKGGADNASATFSQESSALDTIKSKGISVTEMADQSAFVTIAKTIYPKWVDKVGGSAFVEQAANTT